MHSLNLQRAGQAGNYLLEHILLESIGARRGGGLFAWTNTNGIRALIQDEVFSEFLENGAFRLIVGTDAITDLPAVELLQDLMQVTPGLEALAFLSPTSSLFHPKLSWFEHDDYVSIINGSGNLTRGGLKSNWEAFTVVHLWGADAEAALEQIDDFLGDSGDHIYPLNDPRVYDKVRENLGNERSLRGGSGRATIQSAVEDVLVAEIPRSGNRWKQANFDQFSYTDFFGAQVGSQRRISLFHVDADGHIGEIENRPSVEVASRNYRFELNAASGLPYPPNGAPIGIFLRMRSGEFLYHLLLPGGDGYSSMEQLLESSWQGPPRRAKRVRLTFDGLQTYWQDSPFNLANLPSL